MLPLMQFCWSHPGHWRNFELEFDLGPEGRPSNPCSRQASTSRRAVLLLLRRPHPRRPSEMPLPPSCGAPSQKGSSCVRSGAPTPCAFAPPSQSASLHARYFFRPRPRHCCHAFSHRQTFRKLLQSEPNERHKQSGTGNHVSSFQIKNFAPQKSTNPHGSTNDNSSCACACLSRPGPQLVLVAPFPGARVKDKPFD